jgi:hypothetical protein
VRFNAVGFLGRETEGVTPVIGGEEEGAKRCFIPVRREAAGGEAVWQQWLAKRLGSAMLLVFRLKEEEEWVGQVGYKGRVWLDCYWAEVGGGGSFREDGFIVG